MSQTSIFLVTGQSAYCPGNYTMNVYANNFYANNVFTIELSDEFGNFSNPIVIGSLPDTTSTAIPVTIPTLIPDGTGYKVRAYSSSPMDTTATMPIITIKHISTVVATFDTIYNATPFCYGDSVTLKKTTSYPITWSTGSSNLNETFSSSQQVYYYGIDNIGCPFFTDTISVLELPPIIINVSDTVKYCPDHVVKLEISSPGTVSWQGASNISAPDSLLTYIVPQNDLVIRYTFTDSYGCSFMDTIYFIEDPICNPSLENFNVYDHVKDIGGQISQDPRIDSDENGNFYCSGGIDSDSVLIGGVVVQLNPSGQNHGYVVKYDSLFNPLWIVDMYGDYYTMDIKYNNGHLYLRVMNRNSLYINNDTLFSSSYIKNAFLIKLDTADGSIIWYKKFNTTIDGKSGFDVNTNGDVACSLHITNGTLSMDGVNIYNSNSSTNKCGEVIVELDNQGNILSKVDFIGYGGSCLNFSDLSYAENDNALYFGGIYSGNVIINGTDTFLNPNGNYSHALLGRIKGDRTLDWIKSTLKQSGGSVSSIFLDVNHDGDVVFSGRYTGAYGVMTLEGNPILDAFIITYDKYGNYKFFRRIGSLEYHLEYIPSVKYDYLGNIYVAYYNGEINSYFETSQNRFVYKYLRNGIVKYTPSGEVEIVKGEINSDINDLRVNDFTKKIQISSMTQNTTYFENDTLTNSGGTFNYLYASMGIDECAALHPDITICDGDSILIFGNYQLTSGTYYGCNNSVSQELIVFSIDNSLVQLNSTLTSNTNNAAYQWLDCNSNTIITGETAQTYTPTVTGNYAVEITMNGCRATSTCTSISICNVNSTYSYTDNGNGNYSFTNTSNGSYNQSHWSFGDGTTSSSTSPNHTFIANGTFVVILTINDSTIGSSCFDYFIDTINVTGVLSPLQCVSGFVMYPDTTTSNVNVVNSSIGTNLSYFWDFGDGNTSTLAYPTHIYTTAGPFYLCLTIDDGAGCVDMYCDSIGMNGIVFNKQGGFTINVIAPPILTGLENNLASSLEVAIYPNPASDQLTIVSNQTINELTIIDITGKMILTTKQNTDVVNVADLSNGVYFIKLITEEGTITKKFVKQ